MEDKRLAKVGLALFLISTAYDVLVIRQLARRNKMEKWTWLTVVVGVGYTLVAFWFLDRKAARRMFWLFCFSGLPMSIGDLVRWWEREQNGKRVLSNIRRTMNGDV
jgi:amino acid transporter